MRAEVWCVRAEVWCVGAEQATSIQHMYARNGAVCTHPAALWIPLWKYHAPLRKYHGDLISHCGSTKVPLYKYRSGRIHGQGRLPVACAKLPVASVHMLN